MAPSLRTLHRYESITKMEGSVRIRYTYPYVYHSVCGPVQIKDEAGADVSTDCGNCGSDIILIPA